MLVTTTLNPKSLLVDLFHWLVTWVDVIEILNMLSYSYVIIKVSSPDYHTSIQYKTTSEKPGK